MSRRYLLDSGPAQDYVFKRRGIPERVDQARLKGAVVGIGTPVIGEVVAGIMHSKSRDASWAKARPRLFQLVCWTFDRNAALEYGRLFAELRRLGRPMQQIDVQLAAIALTLGNCTVVTYDSDLSAVPGLATENWSKP